MSVYSAYIRTDVTAVKIHENLVIAGIGSAVNIFRKGSDEVLQKLVCLNAQKIYGFVPSSDGSSLLVFGGKQFTLLTRSTDENDGEAFTRVFEAIVCDDWLHSAVWFDEKSIALLTAHNVVQKWNLLTQTLESRHCSKDNSILYSGLLLPLEHDVLTMAGTVFSEVIIHVCGEEQPSHRLKGHKGVIFSICCCTKNHTLVTTSDDRSVRIWRPNTTPKFSFNSTNYWKYVEFACKHELYGHTARVMRSCITDDFIVSVGEDSLFCFWDYEGGLKKKVSCHQNGGIWSVDADDEILVTGGGDCAVLSHPLTTALDNNLKVEVEIGGKPKHVALTAKNNLFILSESNDFWYYDFESQEAKMICKLGNGRGHSLSVSTCKQLCATGTESAVFVFAEPIKGEAVKVFHVELGSEKATSLQWAGNRHLLLGSEDGRITILVSSHFNVEPYTTFLVPNNRNMRLVRAAADQFGNMFVIADRNGNAGGSLRLYRKGVEPPIMTFTKIHGNNGLTSITFRNNGVVTTGRDKTIKYFKITDSKMKHTSTKELEIPWVEKFLDKEENMICGFKEKMFVVFNLKTNSKLLDVDCGGGHRSWDAVRSIDKMGSCYEEVVKLVYLKNSKVNATKFRMRNIVPKHIVKGSHSKEIICLRTYKIDDATLYISGGEDTTLRVSLMKDFVFEDRAVCKYLSSVKTLKTYAIAEDELLVISAGGRAQICIKMIKIFKSHDTFRVETEDLVNYMLKGTDKERKGNRGWRNVSVDFDPETRIMDIDFIKTADCFTVFAGCSDACLRVFTFRGGVFETTNVSRYPTTCILKTVCVNYMNHKIVVTCSTRGVVSLWDATNIENDFKPFFEMTNNKSGINSFAYKEVSDRLLIVTGGDDNAIHLKVLALTDQDTLSSIKVQSSLVIDGHHSSEITGLCLVGHWILSTSIDQRVTLFRWRLSDKIECTFVSQTFSDIADIQGMDLVDHSSSSMTVCVFGKGLEVLNIPTET